MPVCPSNNSASLLLYQSLLTSSELWRGQGQEAKRGEAGEPRTTRNVKRLGRFSSRVQPPGRPCSRCCAWSGQLLGGQPWIPAVTLLHGCDGLSTRRMAVLWTFLEPSLCRHVLRELMRNAWLDFT